jgi:hypothetical protein
VVWPARGGTIQQRITRRSRNLEAEIVSTGRENVTRVLIVRGPGWRWKEVADYVIDWIGKQVPETSVRAGTGTYISGPVPVK